MGCKPLKGKNTIRKITFELIVDDYISNHRDNGAREYRYYRIQPSLEKIIEIATLSKLPSGKRHWHQRRIPRKVLEQARDCLMKADLAGCKNFGELIELTSSNLKAIKGIGDLTIYDITNRIGLYLGLEPEFVYLHAGTREGARAIGLGRGRETLNVEELPTAFHILTPSEIEDCLCIYKDELKRIGE
jgi:hypothetical protein